MIAKKLSTNIASVKLEDNIVRFNVTNDATIEAEEADAIIEACNEAIKKSNYRSIVIISDIRGLKAISHEARDRFSSGLAVKGILANAIIVDSLPTRLIANFFINFHKPIYPAKVFTSEKEAVSWLKNFSPK